LISASGGKRSWLDHHGSGIISGELHLRSDLLATLPGSVFAMHELRRIDLRGNPVIGLSEGLMRLPHLEELDLRLVTTLEPPRWVLDLEAKGCIIYL
jgi:hypothetical protein